MKRNLPKESARSILPGKKVFVGRTLYFIHGLVHGNPWIEINPSFKKEIKEQLLGHNILCEDGFAEWIPHAVSLDEAGYFSFQRLPFFDNIYFLGPIVYSHLSKRNKKQEKGIVSKVKRMTSVQDLMDIRNDLFLNYPPEPEGMNTLMSSQNCGAIENPRGNLPLRIRRYLYEAKTSLKHARENNLGELHLVVGCAHELPLEYLLNNREILDRYSL